MTDLIVMSLERWDDVWRRNQYLITGLLRDDPTLRVLFIEPPDDPLHALRRQLKPEFGSPLQQVDDRLWALRAVKWLPRRFDPHSVERPIHQVRRAAAKLGMTRPLLWLNDPTSAPVAEATGWSSLYDMTDDWLAADRPVIEVERIAEGENWLLANADVVVACSPELVRRKSDQRAGIVLVRNAVDVARYRTPMVRPADLPAGRNAVYVGTLHRDRLDVELCVATARALGDKGTLVLVGPDALAAADSALLRENGVALLGAQPRDAVPAYLQHADVLVVPHVVSDFTESLDPLKLYEYQAVGRPVVSTPVAGFRDSGDDRTTVAEAAEFADAVLQALPQSWPFPQRVGSVASDWSDRVAQVAQIMRPTTD